MVTCAGGISRSSTTVISYLILKKKISAFEALKQIRKHRDVFPSKQQLLYIAKIHNKVFDYEEVEIVDVDMSMSEGRKKILEHDRDSKGQTGLLADRYCKKK